MNTGYGKTFTARYEGLCADCNMAIRAGDTVRYRYNGTKALCHADCEAAKAKAAQIEAEAPYRISGGSGYGCTGWHEGQVVRVDPNKYDGHEFMFVVSSFKDYVREEGMSFGVGDDSGYYYSARCRPATDDEAAPLKAEIEAKHRRREAERARKEIADQTAQAGERPDGMNAPEGDRLMDRQTIYGVGDWFIIGPDHIWYVRNNGMDGDNWSANNVRTGGAGAIGWCVPFDPALAERLREIDTALNA